MAYKKVTARDHSWREFKEDWKKACDEQEEDFSEFISGSFTTLENIARNDDDDTFVCAIVNGCGRYESAFMANYAAIKGYKEKVLRIRHLTFGPNVDFSYTVENYARALGLLLLGILELSQNLKTKHLKIHASSPADMQLFSALSSPLGETGKFKAVDFKGAWLYMEF